MTSPRELLQIQLEGWVDARGRLRDRYGVRIAVVPGSTDEGPILWIGDGVPDALADELAAAVKAAPPSIGPMELPLSIQPPPAAIDACRQLLGEVELSMGPSYVIPDDVQLDSTVEIVCSDGAIDRLRAANPGNWDPVEWDELLDGRLGPWAIAIVDGAAISICHTPVPMTAHAAECGVWTDRRSRGRGYAAATAAAWVPLVRAPGRHVFYMTDADNRSSQCVAARLGAREIGWTWKLHRERPAAPNLHPLCSKLATTDPSRRL
ncbi:MAG TPA: GNAT family protein [Kofleriaceae bacterium]|nr:GNAT family protein [Kofleriaceae bacterium]